MKVSICVSRFPIDLVGKGSIILVRDENIKKRKRVINLILYSKLDFGGNVVKMV
jgi:hypothetical protein